MRALHHKEIVRHFENNAYLLSRRESDAKIDDARVCYAEVVAAASSRLA